MLSRVPASDLAPLLSRRPTLVAVQAFEGASINRIPVAMAQWLAGEYGLQADRSIVQINRVGHTGSSGWNRLARQALFDGAVTAGQHYVLVDDFIGQGGTLAKLRGHIVSRGGLVDACIALTGQARSARIALSQQTLVKPSSNPGGKHKSVSGTSASPSPRQGTCFGSMLAPSEVEFLRQDKASSLDELARLQRLQKARVPTAA